MIIDTRANEKQDSSELQMSMLCYFLLPQLGNYLYVILVRLNCEDTLCIYTILPISYFLLRQEDRGVAPMII